MKKISKFDKATEGIINSGQSVCKYYAIIYFSSKKRYNGVAYLGDVHNMYKLIVIIFGLLWLAGCSSDTEAYEELEDSMSITISPSQARAWMESEPDVIVLDVRSETEFATGYIRGAVLLPVDEIAYRAKAMLPDRDALILAYCRSGVRSLTAAYTLRSMGFTRAYDFGGIIDWPYGVI